MRVAGNLDRLDETDRWRTDERHRRVGTGVHVLDREAKRGGEIAARRRLAQSHGERTVTKRGLVVLISDL